MRRATVGSLYKWTFDDEMPDPAHPTHRATSLAPTWNGPVGAGTRTEIAPGEAAVAAFAAMRRSSRVPGCAARTSLRLRPPLTPRAGPTNAAIVSPVIAVMAATEIEPTVALPARRRPSEVR